MGEVLTADRLREKLVKDYQFNKKDVPELAKDALAKARAAKVARADEAAVTALKVASAAASTASVATATGAVPTAAAASTTKPILAAAPAVGTGVDDWADVDVQKVMEILGLDRRAAIAKLDATGLRDSHAAQAVVDNAFADPLTVVDGIPVGGGTFDVADQRWTDAETWSQNMFPEHGGGGSGGDSSGGMPASPPLLPPLPPQVTEDAIAQVINFTACTREKAISTLAMTTGNVMVAVNQLLGF